MAKMCRRLSAVERVRIELGLRDGLSLTRIAEAIGRPKGTVSKEIARHGGGGAMPPTRPISRACACRAAAAQIG